MPNLAQTTFTVAKVPNRGAGVRLPPEVRKWPITDLPIGLKKVRSPGSSGVSGRSTEGLLLTCSAIGDRPCHSLTIWHSCRVDCQPAKEQPLPHHRPVLG